ncbi:paired amphipathic helix protein sin3-like 1 [Quercus suber]|uniref:Paired amphipathic helix protein sin3-like 1 n=1 Tax=Quercus suber TaxID=58331 RepID=A0AAW0JER2_QUESU
MKRLGDGRSSSQPKPPSGSSRVDSCNGGRGGSDLGCTLREQRKNYALTYLKEVKETLQDQREKYDKFLKVMKDFMDQRTDAYDVIAIVKGLFKGHNNLISGFNFFLPKGSEIALDNDEAHPQELFNEAWSFVTKIKEVKETLQDQREKYDKFLKVMKDFMDQRTDAYDVIAIVKGLFKGHNNLISGFNFFLPKGSEIALDNDEAHPQELFNEAWSFVTKIKVCFQNDASVYREFLDILIEFRKGRMDIIQSKISYGQSQIPVGGGGGGGTPRKITLNDALTYLMEVKETFLKAKEKYGRFLKVIKDFKAKGTLIAFMQFCLG